MSGRVTDSDFNTQIYEEACTWFIEMRAGDVDLTGRQRFDAWVRKSPQHLRAYLEISEIWDDSRLVDRQRACDSEDLLVRAREGAEIVPLTATASAGATDISTGAPAAGGTHLRRTFWGQRWLSAAAMATVTLGLTALLTYEYLHKPTYSTDIGEERTVTLADGSRVELNSRTRVAVRFTDRGRDVDLLQGQALFRVAKDQQRPFIVHSAALIVRAVGTEFDVDRKQSATTVTVLEGRVAVTALPQPELQKLGMPELDGVRLPVFVAAGEQVTAANSQRPLRAARANISAATAWTRGTLVFVGNRLADVVEEFNRHNQRQLIVRDRLLDDMQISGVYASTDPALLVRFLREQPAVRVEETDTTILIFHKITPHQVSTLRSPAPYVLSNAIVIGDGGQQRPV